jgi:cell filamentation protein
MSEYDYEYEWDDKYCYPGSFVLRNKLNILDARTLAEAEREITAVRIGEITDKPVRGKFDLKHLRDIHKAIFRDVYPWAGQLRSVNIAKGNPFCLSVHIETYADDLFAKLKSESFLANANPSEIPERLTYYLSEINVLHPFREGNGRTQRVFTEYLARAAGYRADFSRVSDKEMLDASVKSFDREYDAMTDMFRRIVSPVTPREQQEFLKRIGADRREPSR